MTLTEIQSICEQFPGVTTDIKWDDHLCFCVADKMFLVTAPDAFPVSASFKASNENFELLSVKPGCMPAPYMARYKWIFTDDIQRFSLKEWQELLNDSYHLVASKLPAGKRKALGL